MTWKFFVQSEPWHFSKRLHIINEGGPQQESFRVVRPLILGIYQSGSAVPENECALTDNRGGHNVQDFLQGALDAAWEMGLRPTAYKDHTLELAATRAHLRDMRAIVGHELKVPQLGEGQ